VLDEASIRAVSSWACSQVINSAIPDGARDVFVKMLAVIKKWTSSRGIYSAKMGYPGGIGWTVMCLRILQKEVAKSGVNPASITVDSLVAQFFSTYSAMDFKGASLAMVGQSAVGRNSNARMAIWTPSKPYFNITRNSTNSSVWCMRHQFVAAESFIESAGGVENVDWELFLHQNHHRPLLKSSQTLCLVFVTVSTMTKDSYITWSNFIESRLVGLVISLERVCPTGVVPVLYSRAFYSPTPTYPHQCCFLVILKDTTDSSTLSSMDPSAICEMFRPPAQEWEHTVLSQKPDDGFISVQTYSADKMPKWIFADGATNPENSPSTEEEDEDDGCDVEAFKELLHNNMVAHEEEPAHLATAVPVSVPAPASASSASSTFKSKNGKKQKGSSASASASAAAPSGKLRKSEDVYNRIMWDPKFNKAEYSICYEDRFLGLMEVPFESFDHENIPFHRVWLFKHRGDIIWDRENRIDRVF